MAHFALLVVCGALLIAARRVDGQVDSIGRPPTLTYSVIDLGTLGGSSSVALGVNDHGQVVGSADTSQGLRHAYLWENGVMTDLGTLGFPTAQSEAWDINNHGVVVGNVGTGDPNKAFIWENGIQTEIGPPQVLKSAYGINDAKQVVGQFIVPAGGGDRHAFLWQNGTMTDLGTLGGTYSIAWDINENGQVAGGSSTDGAPGGAFLWHNGVMTSLGTLGGATSGAVDLNDAGVVVGSAQRTTAKNALLHAFLWQDGVMTDLGLLGGFNSSRAEAINNDGLIVGVGTTGAFIYDPRIGMCLLQDLIPPSSGWSQLSPRAINNAGWIVGVGTGPAGRHAFLMKPETLIPTVSEYGMIVMTLLLLTCATLLMRRRESAHQ